MRSEVSFSPDSVGGTSGSSMAPLGGTGGDANNRLRPLSIASTSSTSTTSSSHQKHPSNSYLASAESLQDGTFSPISDDEGEAGDRLRYTDNVVHEVLETERAYVHDLGVVIQGYQRPIRECGASEGFVSEKDLEVLFGNLEQILQFHSAFLERLTSECSRRLLAHSSYGEHNGNNAVAIAECFLAQFGGGQGVEVYASYCTNYPRSLQVLSQLVKPDTRSCALLSKLQLGLGHRMQLGSYLLKPVQRILKYPLLLDALRHFEKDYPGCAGQDVIEKALKTMQQIANKINEIKKLDEDAVRVQEVQSVLQGWPGNDLTTYGGLVAEEKVMCSKKILMQIFLFEKMLLITKRKRKAPNLLWYVQHIATNDLMVNESSWMVVGDCSFQVLSKSNRQLTFVFETTGRERKKLWCDRLNKIILDSLDISPEQRSKILENLRRERNLNYNLSKREHNNSLKAHKKCSRGFDSLKKATGILHRRRASVDNSSLRTAQQQTTAPPKKDTTLTGGSLRIKNTSKKTSSEQPQTVVSRPNFKLREHLPKLNKDHQSRKLRRCVSDSELEVPVRGRRHQSNAQDLQRSSSLPRSIKLNHSNKSKNAVSASFHDPNRNRQWKHLLFTMGSRLRTSLLSTDSGGSSTTETRRPASMDSALFCTNSDSEDEEHLEEELESNNSSGSFYERNFELCCRDEIFRDSAIFSEDAISELSAEFLVRDYTDGSELKGFVRQLNEVEEKNEKEENS